MKTIHVYKADCFESSRVMLQSQWDKSTVLFHRPKTKSKSSLNDLSSHHLSHFALAKALVRQPKGEAVAVVAHAQSSLPYLVTCLLIKKLGWVNQPKLIYDMHDLLEQKEHKSLWRWLRHSIIRYLIFYKIEKAVFHDPEITKTCVSKGLAAKIAQVYSAPPAQIVRSAPPPNDFSSTTNRKQNTLVYFGTINHFPFSVLKLIDKEDIKLEVYGRGITYEALEAAGAGDQLKNVEIFGKYHPSDMNFLSQYRYLLLYAPNKLTLNYRYSQPNKLFQAINHGLSLIVSENFKEIIEILAPVPGSVGVLSERQSIRSVIQSIELQKSDSFERDLRCYSGRLRSEAQKAYLKALGI